MQPIIGIIILVFDILAIVDIVKSSKTSGQKILWVLLVLFLPLVGMLLYFIIGKKKS